jgi:hypothetical protein
MSKPKRKEKKPQLVVAAVALDEAIKRIRELARDCAKMTDRLNALKNFLGKMRVDGRGNLVGWSETED